METIELTIEDLGMNQITLEGVLTFEYVPGEDIQMPSFGNETGYPGSPDEWHFHSFETQTWSNGAFKFTREENKALVEMCDSVALNHIREREDFYSELISEEKSDV